MRRRLLLSLLAPMLILGCVSTTLTGRLPEIPNPAETAEFYLIRTNSFVGRAGGVPIAIDGDEIFILGSNQHTRLTVPAGEFNREHSVTANRRDQLNVLCEPGGQYFFLIDTGGRGRILTQIAEAEAREWMAKTEYVRLIGGKLVG